MGATSYIAQCRDTQTPENCVPKGRDIYTKFIEPTYTKKAQNQGAIFQKKMWDKVGPDYNYNRDEIYGYSPAVSMLIGSDSHILILQFSNSW